MQLSDIWNKALKCIINLATNIKNYHFKFNYLRIFFPFHAYVFFVIFAVFSECYSFNILTENIIKNSVDPSTVALLLFIYVTET